MRKKYEQPICEEYLFSDFDIVVCSGTGEDSDFYDNIVGGGDILW